MKKGRYKKIITVLTVMCGLIFSANVFFDFILPLFLSFNVNGDVRDVASVGIIGGADGPTAIFIASKGPKFYMTVIFAILTVIGLACLKLFSRKDTE